MDAVHEFTLDELAQALLADVVRANLGLSQARVHALHEFADPEARERLVAAFPGVVQHSAAIDAVLREELRRALSVGITHLSVRVPLEHVEFGFWRRLWCRLFMRRVPSNLYRLATDRTARAIRYEVTLGPAPARSTLGITRAELIDHESAELTALSDHSHGELGA